MEPGKSQALSEPSFQLGTKNCLDSTLDITNVNDTTDWMIVFIQLYHWLTGITNVADTTDLLFS